MAFTKDPVLAIWQAMQPLAAINIQADTPAISKILTEAEMTLFGLIRAIIWHSENGIDLNSGDTNGSNRLTVTKAARSTKPIRLN